MFIHETLSEFAFATVIQLIQDWCVYCINEISKVLAIAIRFYELLDLIWVQVEGNNFKYAKSRKYLTRFFYECHFFRIAQFNFFLLYSKKYET